MFDHGNHDHNSQHAATAQFARPRPPKRKDFQAPHKDPSTGRFVQRDPLGYEFGSCIYEYAYSSPLTWSDHDGLSPLSDAQAALRGVAQAKTQLNKALAALKAIADQLDQANDDYFNCIRRLRGLGSMSGVGGKLMRASCKDDCNDLWAKIEALASAASAAIAVVANARAELGQANATVRSLALRGVRKLYFPPAAGSRGSVDAVVVDALNDLAWSHDAATDDWSVYGRSSEYGEFAVVEWDGIYRHTFGPDSSSHEYLIVTGGAHDEYMITSEAARNEYEYTQLKRGFSGVFSGDPSSAVKVLAISPGTRNAFK